MTEIAVCIYSMSLSKTDAQRMVNKDEYGRYA